MIAIAPLLKKSSRRLHKSIIEMDLFGYKTYVAGGAAAGLWGIVHMPLAESLIAGYFIAALLYQLSSRPQFGLALVLLVVAAALSQTGKLELASRYAAFAYYFLGIGMVVAILELVRGIKAEKTLA